MRLPGPARPFRFVVRPYAIAGETLNIFIGPPNCTGGYGLTSGLNGLLWYTLYGYGCNNGDIVTLTTNGAAAVAYPLSGLLAYPYSIAEGADGRHMWFTTEGGADRLGSITATGGMTPFAVPNTPNTSGITSGPDTRLWFGISSALIGAASQSGVVTTYKLPSPYDNIGAVAVGSDNNIWYSLAGGSFNGQIGIGKITTRGVATDYVTGFGTNSVAKGADGNTWFTVSGQSKVGFITTRGGGPTTFSLGISGLPGAIVTGPDNNEYFTEYISNTQQAAIGKITLGGVVTEYALPYGFNPSAITVGPDKNIWVLDANHDQLGQLVLPKPKTPRSAMTASGMAIP